MKKLIFTLALLAQTAFGFATENKNTNQYTAVSVRYENVQMYRQPGTSTEVLKALQSTDEIKFVRRFNSSWSILLVNGQVGYVLTAEIGQAKAQTIVSIAKK